MALQIMLAVHHQDKQWFQAMLRQNDHDLIMIDSMAEAQTHLGKTLIEVALVDVNFDGIDSGWMLAREIRAKLPLNVRIIILCDNAKLAMTYFKNTAYAPMYDWILHHPVYSEQLLSEVERGLS